MPSAYSTKNSYSCHGAGVAPSGISQVNHRSNHQFIAHAVIGSSQLIISKHSPPSATYPCSHSQVIASQFAVPSHSSALQVTPLGSSRVSSPQIGHAAICIVQSSSQYEQKSS